MSRRHLTALFVSTLFCFVSSTHAATITVNTTTDEYDVDSPNSDCSVREAFASANYDLPVGGCVTGSGDDTVEIPAGTYPLTIDNCEACTADPSVALDPVSFLHDVDGACGDLVLIDNTVVNGVGATIDASAIGINDQGGDRDRVLTIYPAESFFVLGAEVGATAQGAASGGAFQLASVSNDLGASAALKAIFPSANSQQSASASGTQDLQGQEGGNEFCKVCGAGPIVELNGLTFTGGSEFEGGGLAIYTQGCAMPSVNGSFSATGNHADFRGGGIYNNALLSMEDGSAITNNTVRAEECLFCFSVGGGLFNFTPIGCAGVNSLDGVDVGGNRASAGGGVANIAGIVNITNTSIHNNGGDRPQYESGIGGGVVNAAQMSITDSFVVDNFAGPSSPYGEGGGIYNGFAFFGLAGAAPFPVPEFCLFGARSVGGAGDDDDDDDNGPSDELCQSGLTILRSSVSRNHSVTSGGMANYGEATVIESTFDSNTADLFAGGVGNFGFSLFLLPGAAECANGEGPCFPCVFGEGECFPPFFVRRGFLDVDSSTFSNNVAKYSGGIFTSAPFNGVNSTISSNTATLGGAGGLTVAINNFPFLFPFPVGTGVPDQGPPIEVKPIRPPEAVVNNCTITLNRVDLAQSETDEYLELFISGLDDDDDDGPVSAEYFCDRFGITGADSFPAFFEGPSAGPAGGGVAVIEGLFKTANTIIAENEDGQVCSFLELVGAGPEIVLNPPTNPFAPDIYIPELCSFVEGSDVSSQGISYDGEKFCYFPRFKFLPFAAADDDDDDIFDFLPFPQGISEGYNLVGDISGGELFQSTEGDKIGTNDSPIDPGLGPLADNGGPTLTHLPLAGSLAIDMGNPDAVSGAGFEAPQLVVCRVDDQRSVGRPIDGDDNGSEICDIGAVEVDVDRCGVPGGDGTSCLECEEVDVTKTQFTLDGNALKLRTVVRQAARYLRAEGKKRAAKEAVKLADALYTDGWLAIWEIPSVFNSCENKELCVSTDNSTSINTFSASSDGLFNLSNSTVKKLKSTAKRIKRKLRRKAKKLHDENLALAATIPASAESCD